MIPESGIKVGLHCRVIRIHVFDSCDACIELLNGCFSQFGTNPNFEFENFDVLMIIHMLESLVLSLLNDNG